MINEATTFWKFISSHRIGIPIIQRDYAQGREGKEYLRRNFLTGLKAAMDDRLNDGHSTLKLDFIYASERGGKLYPLDGQQRLTTLWLLHWYVALRAGVLKEHAATLRKFTYETRVSSREFCGLLCHADNFKSYDASCSIVYFITNSTWFCSSWKQDPTIRAMLRMVGGTKVNDRSGEGIVDGLEELFRGAGEDEFKRYWSDLISDNAPIVFYYLPLVDFGLSDDLYIKMNARGKQLTPFENFKADLIGYIKEQAQTAGGAQGWNRLLDEAKGFAHKMDVKWMDLFWDKAGARVDEAYFAFLNRFFWNGLFTAKDGDGSWLLKVGSGQTADGKPTSTVENENRAYRCLNKDDCSVYDGLDVYKLSQPGGELPLRLFEDLEAVLDRYRGMRSGGKACDVLLPRWKEEFDFIPRYNNGETGRITQIQRIAFFAVCKYFKEGAGDDVSLRRWMRVVWNLISGIDEGGNPQIRDVSAVRRAIELIDKLDSHDVYRSLCEGAYENDAALGKRYNEEKEKAGQILCGDGSLRKYGGTLRKEDGSPYATWEELIAEAEGYSFFKGSIRFLFRDGNGEANWEHFDTKWAHAKQYFQKETEVPIDLLKALISRFTPDQVDSVLSRHSTLNGKPASWMYYLLNDHLFGPVHQLLYDGDGSEVKRLPDGSGYYERVLYALSNTKLLDYVVGKMPSARIWGDRLYPSHARAGIYLNHRTRDRFFRDTKEIALHDDYKVPDTDFLYGWDVNFSYRGRNFQWYRNNFVYLMKDDDPNDYLIKDASAPDELGKYYCFNASQLDGNEILHELKELAKVKQPVPGDA